MIRIVITETTAESYVERVNVKCIEEYETENVTKERIVSTELLERNVPSDTFDLKAVIKAINGLT